MGGRAPGRRCLVSAGGARGLAAELGAAAAGVGLVASVFTHLHALGLCLDG